MEAILCYNANRPELLAQGNPNRRATLLQEVASLAIRKYTISRKPPDGLKFCASGDHLLPATPEYFPVRLQYRDGFGYTCKECKRKDQREGHHRRKPPCPSCGQPKQIKPELCRSCFLNSLKEITDADFILTPSGCLEFQGSRGIDGYGRKGSERVHCIIWERHYGPIPPGLCVLHRCDNPPCANIAHLFLGTRTDNAIDKMLKGRAAQRLSIPEVLEIRSLSDLPRKTVAERFNVSTVTVVKIWRRESWAWLQ